MHNASEEKEAINFFSLVLSYIIHFFFSAASMHLTVTLRCSYERELRNTRARQRFWILKYMLCIIFKESHWKLYITLLSLYFLSDLTSYLLNWLQLRIPVAHMYYKTEHCSEPSLAVNKNLTEFCYNKIHFLMHFGIFSYVNTLLRP